MFPRSAITRSSALTLRRTATRLSTLPIARFQSTSSSSSSSSSSFFKSYIVSGVAGGVTVILTGYGLYHFSGIGAAMQKAKDAKASLKSTRDSIIAKVHETTPNPTPQDVAKVAKESFTDMINKKAKDLSEKSKKDAEKKA